MQFKFGEAFVNASGGQKLPQIVKIIFFLPTKIGVLFSPILSVLYLPLPIRRTRQSPQRSRCPRWTRRCPCCPWGTFGCPSWRLRESTSHVTLEPDATKKIYFNFLTVAIYFTSVWNKRVLIQTNYQLK